MYEGYLKNNVIKYILFVFDVKVQINFIIYNIVMIKGVVVYNIYILKMYIIFLILF